MFKRNKRGKVLQHLSPWSGVKGIIPILSNKNLNINPNTFKV